MGGRPLSIDVQDKVMDKQNKMSSFLAAKQLRVIILKGGRVILFYTHNMNLEQRVIGEK